MVDFTDQYNTTLTPEKEEEFKLWQAEHPKLGNTYDYDARGFWQAGAGTGDNGHGADTFKKPNHPTFSDQSIYHDQDGYYGGTWMTRPDGGYSFHASETNMRMYDPAKLSDYFKKVEPGNNVVFGEQTTQKFFAGDLKEFKGKLSEEREDILTGYRDWRKSNNIEDRRSEKTIDLSEPKTMAGFVRYVAGKFGYDLDDFESLPPDTKLGIELGIHNVFGTDLHIKHVKEKLHREEDGT